MKNVIKELNQKNIKELDKEAQSLREEIAKTKLDWTANQPKDTNILIKKKKKLSQILTVLQQKVELEKLNK
ncbi:MAG: hypothetical protein HYW86_02125 [Candidatus Roizmanbacteria bacterium]|nr:MAG: hypothetical protein HYW86_02125 [Candidatus Roizmanbacteria bacterium]